MDNTVHVIVYVHWDSDYLDIRDGPQDDSILLVKLCGKEIPD